MQRIERPDETVLVYFIRLLHSITCLRQEDE